MAHIILDHVSLEYPLYGPAARSIRSMLLRPAIGARLEQSDHNVVHVRALNDVSLRLEDGARIGLIGANGAGKSTLLRLMAGVYEPTAGRISRAGRIRTLFDISQGMDEESSGYENIFIRGLFLDVNRREIKAAVDEIVDFTELGDYIKMPLRTYSAGMRVRRAFAVSTAFKGEIVLMDEVFGVGDQRFYNKAAERLATFIGESGIVVLASHSLQLVQSMCQEAVWLDSGRLAAAGQCSEVIQLYAA